MLSDQAQQTVAEGIAVVLRPDRVDTDGRVGLVDRAIRDAAVGRRSGREHDGGADPQPDHLE